MRGVSINLVSLDLTAKEAKEIAELVKQHTPNSAVIAEFKTFTPAPGEDAMVAFKRALALASNPTKAAIVLDPYLRRMTINGIIIVPSPQSFKFLWAFEHHDTLSFDQVAVAIYGQTSDNDRHNAQTLAHRVRQHLGEYKSILYNVRGFGYGLEKERVNIQWKHQSEQSSSSPSTPAFSDSSSDWDLE